MVTHISAISPDPTGPARGQHRKETIITAYYNEIDPFAANWLRALIDAGHIAPGVVDQTPIQDVVPNDLKEFAQCHFFAGIGTWSLALRNAGWPDSRPVWTGSCPCQPFSAAGRRMGQADDRHLWPHFHWLIEQQRPDVVFAEQVASKDGLAWLDTVQADLEGAGYAVGAFDLCAAGVGAPHIRQRLFIVGHAVSAGLEGHAGDEDDTPGRPVATGSAAAASGTDRLADADSRQCDGWAETAARDQRHRQNARRSESYSGATRGRDDGGLAVAYGGNTSTEREQRSRQHGLIATDSGVGVRTSRTVRTREVERGRAEPGPTNGDWRAADWLRCTDGKWRPVEPGTFPLAHGVAGRVGRLRGYGNGIVEPLARAFIEAFLDHEIGTKK